MGLFRACTQGGGNLRGLSEFFPLQCGTLGGRLEMLGQVLAKSRTGQLANSAAEGRKGKQGRARSYIKPKQNAIRINQNSGTPQYLKS